MLLRTFFSGMLYCQTLYDVFLLSINKVVNSYHIGFAKIVGDIDIIYFSTKVDI